MLGTSSFGTKLSGYNFAGLLEDELIMSDKQDQTFIIDCPYCSVKVAALEKGKTTQEMFDEDSQEPFAYKVQVGNCPKCNYILVGASEQTEFKGYNAYHDGWSDVIRVYPDPSKTFFSSRIPKVVKDSLNEADRSLQAGANIAACVMFGRALEALCRDVIYISTPPDFITDEQAKPKKIMLDQGIEKLKELKVIDERLYDWSQQLKAFRNLAAHPEDISISREDANDLQIFVYAIVEYIYDLTDRYDEFKARSLKRETEKKA